MGGCCSKQPSTEEINSVIQDALQMGKKPVFWIIGGPGSGKGTQCFKLSMKYKLAHLSTGELLRAEVGRGSEMGRQIHSMVTTGQLVPREIVLDLLKNAMVQAYPHVKGYLIDGYPREVVQGSEFLTKVGPCTKLIYFQCSDETMKTRLTKRAETSGRADDNVQTVLNRIRIFHEISEEVVRSYDSLLYTVNSDREPDQVFEDCCTLLDPIIAPIAEPEPLPPPPPGAPPPRGPGRRSGPPGPPGGWAPPQPQQPQQQQQYQQQQQQYPQQQQQY